MKLLPGKLLERLEDDFFWKPCLGNSWEVEIGVKGQVRMVWLHMITWLSYAYWIYIYIHVYIRIYIYYHCNVWYFFGLDHADSSFDFKRFFTRTHLQGDKQHIIIIIQDERATSPSPPLGMAHVENMPSIVNPNHDSHEYCINSPSPSNPAPRSFRNPRSWSALLGALKKNKWNLDRPKLEKGSWRKWPFR